MYDIANMKVYRKHLYITSLNQSAELVRAKLAASCDINIDHRIQTNDYTWGQVKRDWLPTKPIDLYEPSTQTGTSTYIFKNKHLTSHQREILDVVDIKS